ncbi:MAG: hypothetical protein A2W91_00315 [Bacteroidetes bacterium GWF2_38_335]|nr:MAG: hypothetical protein A2W91_00315 [Bacteroidetes bacterium GWF2_38_335]OFY78277.1 MAG: hypothetical protein A2281_03695 [Bacteroidetes bacterium RIFOXYA12_FULL_38_20]HBS87529.1 hypothetical protein [Bacteroidales bacterium]
MDLSHLKTGLIISLFIILYGFTLGIIFGAFEEDIKENYRSRAETVLDETYKGDTALLDKTVSKAWEFLKHAHTHALGLGPISLLLIIVLSFLQMPGKLKFYTGLAVSIGSLGYPVYWTVASVIAPTSGNHEAARESLWWMAQPTAGLCFLGLIVIIFYAFKSIPCCKKQ